MSAKPISEYDGKHLLSYWLPKAPEPDSGNPPDQKSLSFLANVRMATVSFANNSSDIDKKQVLDQVLKAHPWLLTEKLVCKPDQLIKRRGKAGLLGIKLDWKQVCDWILERAGKNIQIEKAIGTLNTFIIEPFLPHTDNQEYYVCIQSVRAGDEILFTNQGGVDIGDVDAKATRLLMPVDGVLPSKDEMIKILLKNVPQDEKKDLAEFISRLFAVFTDLQFTYLEINPLVVTRDQGKVQFNYLDLAAKLDQTAEFECGKKWAMARLHAYPGLKTQTPSWGPPLNFPAPFGRELTKEEAYISDIDGKTGASLKLTVLNSKGRIWTMVAGGGASVVYSDAIAAHGYSHELANYGEYSGAPSESQT
jgi:ATP citrate (pro-S)-lyase